MNTSERRGDPSKRQSTGGNDEETLHCRAVGAATLLGAVTATAAAPVAAQTPPKDPIVIVGGFLTGQPIANIFYTGLADRLRADGYQAFIFGPVDFGLADIRDSAAALNQFVDGVEASTGAQKVDLIGHSQGGLTSRYYIKNLGGATEVDSMISLASLHYGTSVANLGAFLLLGDCVGIAGCEQMRIGPASSTSSTPETTRSATSPTPTSPRSGTSWSSPTQAASCATATTPTSPSRRNARSGSSST